MKQMDLFEWAANRPTAAVISLPAVERPTAVILDARPRLEPKVVAFFKAMVDGWEPPYRDGQIVTLEERRRA